MLRKARRMVSVLLALVMTLVFSLSVSAFVFNTPKTTDVTGIVIGEIEDDSMTAVFTISSSNPQSVNYSIKGDGLDPEFWNKADAYVEADITLNTDVTDVYAILPAFARMWNWIDPTVRDTYLVYGETVTVREPFSTYYEGFKNGVPQCIRVHICTNSVEEIDVEVQISNIRLVGVDNPPAQTTTAATTTTVAATTTTVAETTTTAATTTAAPEEEPEIATQEPAATEEAATLESATQDAASTQEVPAVTDQTTTTSATTTAAATVATTAAATAAKTTAATTVSVGQAGGFNLSGTIIAIVVGAVVIVAAAVVGYIIYKKKKYY